MYQEYLLNLAKIKKITPKVVEIITIIQISLLISFFISVFGFLIDEVDFAIFPNKV